MTMDIDRTENTVYTENLLSLYVLGIIRITEMETRIPYVIKGNVSILPKIRHINGITARLATATFLITDPGAE